MLNCFARRVGSMPGRLETSGCRGRAPEQVGEGLSQHLSALSDAASTGRTPRPSRPHCPHLAAFESDEDRVDIRNGPEHLTLT